MTAPQRIGDKGLHREQLARRSDCFDVLVLALHHIEPAQHSPPFHEPALMQQLFDVGARIIDRCNQPTLGDVVAGTEVSRAGATTGVELP